jgi:hypothetical protein
MFRLLTLLLGAFLLLGLAACGGGDDGDEDGDEPTATAPVATEAPDGTEPTDEPDATSEPLGESPFDSYHYTVDLEFTILAPGEEDQAFVTGRVEGDFVAPDRHAFETSFEFAGLSVTEEAVLIGDDAWIRMGGGDWRATSRSDPDVVDAIELTSADPGFLDDTDFAQDLAALDSTPEEINGVQTRRYFIPSEAVDTLVDLLGEDFLADTAGLQEFEMTVWLEEETGALVRAEFDALAGPEILADGSGFDLPEDASAQVVMVIDRTQINDSGISIEPPI